MRTNHTCYSNTLAIPPTCTDEKLCPLSFPVCGTGELVNNQTNVVLDKFVVRAFILPFVLLLLLRKIMLEKRKSSEL